MKNLVVFCLFGFSLSLSAWAEESSNSLDPVNNSTITINPVKAISNLDIDRYMGKWYEIARLPAYFEQRCQAPIVSDYKRDSDLILVADTCMTVSGSILNFYNGVAYISDNNLRGSGEFISTSTPAWLRWTHVGRSDYWVLYTDYSYALVGTPDHSNLWIFSRNENPPLNNIQDMIELARQQGFDVSKLSYNYPSYYAR